MIVIVGVALALLLAGIVFWLLLTRRIREKYAILWLIISLGVIVVGAFPGLLARVSVLLGVELPSNLLFTVAVLLLLGVTLHLSYELSRAEEEIRRTAEEAAITGALLTELDRRLRALERERSEGERDREADEP